MTQKEYVNLERAMQELYARQAFTLKELWLGGLIIATPALLYIPIFAVLLNVTEGTLSAVIVWSVLGLLIALPAGFLLHFALTRKKSSERMQEIQPVVMRSTLGSKHEKELVKHEGVYLVPSKRRTLIGSVENDSREYKRGYWYDQYVMYFPEGRFLPPFKSFTWSKEYAMTAKGLFLYAQPGDEFYLLIGQTWQGKPKREILLACPAKLFRWEETEISQSDKNENE